MNDCIELPQGTDPLILRTLAPNRSTAGAFRARASQMSVMLRIQQGRSPALHAQRRGWIKSHWACR
jgi:hypothetical protein